ncbi:MAG TPA: SRPBCC domain-containing protein [Gammaproteobacteria bacterium]|nr:SRPBCC domain-containing protein [Gammaproteobacteria bacterium]
MNAASRDSNPNEFVISRVFAAPRELVWKAWTEPERLMQWFGPKGVTMPKCDMDFRPGGMFHYCMLTPDGHEMWGKWIFREIEAPARLMLISSFSDANGGITRHPLNPQWPLETLSTTTFEPQGNRTLLTIRWTPLNATADEQATFAQSHASMQQGWGGTMEQLENYLKTV